MQRDELPAAQCVAAEVAPPYDEVGVVADKEKTAPVGGTRAATSLERFRRGGFEGLPEALSLCAALFAAVNVRVPCMDAANSQMIAQSME